MKSQFLKKLKATIAEKCPEIYINFISLKQVAEGKTAIKMLAEAGYATDNANAPQQIYRKNRRV